MAVVGYSVKGEGRGWQVIAWENMDYQDTGAPFIAPHFSDKSIQLTGTLSTGGECTIQGSNFVSTPTWATLADPQGTALTMTALGLETILENIYQIRPNITGGDGSTDLTVTLLISTTR